MNNTNNWSPCLPISFIVNVNTSINIKFDPYYIQEFTDWYPLNMCNNLNDHRTYRNEYFFDSTNSIIINNLIINKHYGTYYHSEIGFIRSTGYDTSVLACVDCNFVNISSPISSLFTAVGSISLFENHFSSINTSGSIFYKQNVDNMDFSARSVGFTV